MIRKDICPSFGEQIQWEPPKTCGECKHFDPSAYMDMGCDIVYGVCYADDLACSQFSQWEEQYDGTD